MTLGAISGVVGLLVVAAGGTAYLHTNFLQETDRDEIELLIAQNDINARLTAGKAQAGDASRKLILEARIKALLAK